jgi:hypothetical protein
VFIDVDVAAHLDRAIELINRTNQLNFTKRRLPDAPEAARTQLLKNISQFYAQAALIRVVDKYGDYGYCGYYRTEGEILVDYCFSCRVLGIGVESWLYERLGRPSIKIMGNVLTDLTQPKTVDWITLTTDHEFQVAKACAAVPEVRLRGGCELDALAHYFRFVSDTVKIETNRTRPPIFVRMDNSAQLVPAMGGVPPEFYEAATNLGFAPEDFESEFLLEAKPGSILIYSPWADIYQAVYRHKSAEFRVPLDVHIFTDLAQIKADELAVHLHKLNKKDEERRKIKTIVDTLRSDYEYELCIPVQDAVEIMRRIFERVPFGARLFIILPHEWYKDGDTMVPRGVEYNAAVQALAAGYPAVSIISMNDVVYGPTEMQGEFDHFDRVIYFRLYQRILGEIEATALKRSDGN